MIGFTMEMEHKEIRNIHLYDVAYVHNLKINATKNRSSNCGLI